MDKVVSRTAALGIPGLILLTAIGATGLYGGAAITLALASLGPGGILGGIATLGVIGMISEAVTEYGFDTIYAAVVKEMYKRGYSKQELFEKIEKSPLSKKLKSIMREKLNKL